MARLFTDGERELIEDALKASAFKYRHAFVNAAARVADRLNQRDDTDGLKHLTDTEEEFIAKAKAFETLATVFRRYPVLLNSVVEIPEQA
jgi:hypothetical protein